MWILGVQVGFRFGFGGSGWVQVGFKLGSGLAFWGSDWVQVGFRFCFQVWLLGVQVGFSYSICKNTAFPHHRYRNAASSCIEKPYILHRKLAYRIMSHYIILYTVLYCVDTGGNELAPWVHRCCFFGFSLGPGLAVWGSGWVQVGFRFRVLGSGWVRVGFRFGVLVQVGFRFGVLGSGWVQVGFKLGSSWVQVGFKLGTSLAAGALVWFKLGSGLAFGVQVGFRFGVLGFRLGS